MSDNNDVPGLASNKPPAYVPLRKNTESSKLFAHHPNGFWMRLTLLVICILAFILIALVIGMIYSQGKKK